MDVLGTNPYKLNGPQVISFSGGRTSGFMLAKIVEAHNGELPDYIKVVFANTGLEHPATLEYVREVSDRITPVTWVEYTTAPDGEHNFRTVTFNTASRKGEPMEAIIRKRGYLPNVVSRFCTAETKIRTISRYIKSTYKWTTWTDLIGLRADEPRRVHRLKADGKRDILCPIYSAGHTLEDVLQYWKAKDFDLELPYGDNSYGNCTGCFLKSTGKLLRIFKENPEVASWYIDMEELIGDTFRRDRPSYKVLLDMAISQQTITFPEHDIQECSCTD